MQDYIDNFWFRSAPFSSIWTPVIGTSLYLLGIYVLQMVVKKRHDLVMVTAIHNLFLCLLSAAMMTGMIVHLTPFVKHFGWFHVFCDANGPPHPELNMNYGGMCFWCYVFYVSKFYEMVDTILLVMKKRPLTLVHVYHHFIVPYLFWTFMNTETTGHWMLAFNNSLVHVFMYYYYMMTTLGYSVWWKKYLTQLQIVQFFVDMFVTWPHLLFMRALQLWDCKGSTWSVYMGQYIGVSFIVLFTLFYMDTYVVVPPRKEADKTAEDKAHDTKKEIEKKSEH